GDPSLPGAGYAAIAAPSRAVINVPIPDPNNDLTFTARQPGDALNNTTVHIVNSGQSAPPLLAAKEARDGTLDTTKTYFWVITAITPNGETTKSNETSLAPSGTNKTATLTWSQVPNATGYNVYRSNTADSYGASSLLTTIGSGST